jgi:light-regulated signal transduction histidine kinase (bacteriophytochrome)
MANAEDPVVDSPAADLALLRDEVDRYTHALANVLGAILNYSAFLAEDLETSEVADATTYLSYLDNAAHRAVELINALGEASRA